MKTNFLKHMMLLQVVLVCLIGNAQVRTKTYKLGIPVGVIANNVREIPDILIKAPDGFSKLLSKTDEAISNEFLFKFAEPKQIDVDVLSHAKMIEENGNITYITTVTAENAVNISLQFKQFFLPEHAILSIYTQHEITDNITQEVNNVDKAWGTRIYHSNQITIVLKLPVSEKDRALLKIGKVNFGFKKLDGDNFGNPGGSANCNINVVCPEAFGWYPETNSVALVSIEGGYLFTGSLVMNTCMTNIPYFLTAYHNFIDPLTGAPLSPSSCVFQFQYWSSICSPNAGWSEDMQFFGAQPRASWSPSDFALVELNTPIPASSFIHFAGWNRINSVPNGSVSLHHPAADLMKFSRDFQSSTESSWGGINNHWVSNFDQGTVQYGSSGAPLFNMSRQIVGQLHGSQIIPQDFCTQRIGEYGKFSSSWTGGGSKFNSLAYWLDPTGTGQPFTATTNVAALYAPLGNLSISGDDAFCVTSKLYTIPGLPNGASVHWEVSPLGAATPNTPNNPQTTLTVGTGGTITLTATITFGACSTPIIKQPIHASAGTAPSCSTRVAYQMVNGNQTYLNNCAALTQLRYVDGNPLHGQEYFTNAWVVDPTAEDVVTPTGTLPAIEWTLVSASGNSAFLANGANVEVFINKNSNNGWIRLKCTTRNACGSYSWDFWFTPLGSTVKCPVRPDMNCALAEPIAITQESVTKASSEKISLSPNPTNGQFKVLLSSDVQDAVIREIRIKNKMGVAVYQQVYKNSQKERTVNLYNLPTDIYLIEVFDGKKWMTEKLSLQR